MSGMEAFLAQHYGTAGGATSTEPTLDKEAEASFELFAKVAAAEGIDLSTMSDEDVMALYTKVASEDEPKEEPKDEKKEEEKKEKEAAAKAELAAKTASSTAVTEAQEKLAEADFLGRVMAHAYVQEMKKIAEETAAAATEPAPEETKTAKLEHTQPAFLKARGFADKLRAGLHHAKGAVGGAADKAKEHAGKAADKAGKHLESVGKKVTEKATGVGTSNMKPSHAKGVGAGVYGAGAAAAGGAAAAAHKEKKGSALDELAAERAMAKIAEAGFDTDQGADLLSQLIIAGANEENSKIASAGGDLAAALEIRSLELLEQCGYPITWE